MSISSNDYFLHIRDELKFILHHTVNLSYDGFLKDEVLQKAVVRSLEIIGEATKKIDSKVIRNNPQIDWRSMAKTRDKLIHHYFGVDYEIVWDIIVDKLPYLLKQIEDLIKKKEES